MSTTTNWEQLHPTYARYEQTHQTQGCDTALRAQGSGPCHQAACVTESFFQVSIVGPGVQAFESLSTAFPGHLQEQDRKWSIQDLNLRP